MKIILKMYKSVQAAITKYQRQGGLNNRHLFLTILEAENSKIKVLADSVIDNRAFPWLADDHLLAVYSRDRDREFWSFFLLQRH